MTWRHRPADERRQSPLTKAARSRWASVACIRPAVRFVFPPRVYTAKDAPSKTQMADTDTRKAHAGTHGAAVIPFDDGFDIV